MRRIAPGRTVPCRARLSTVRGRRPPHHYRSRPVRGPRTKDGARRPFPPRRPLCPAPRPSSGRVISPEVALREAKRRGNKADPIPSQIDGTPRRGTTLEFLPSALEIIETPGLILPAGFIMGVVVVSSSPRNRLVLVGAARHRRHPHNGGSLPSAKSGGSPLESRGEKIMVLLDGDHV